MRTTTTQDTAAQATLPRKTSTPDAPRARRSRVRKFTVADLFAGAGGFSTGAARALAALGHDIELTMINHWDVAVATHQLNHPDAKHHCQDLASVRPISAVPDGRLDLLLASPTCTYFSRARGSKPVTDQQRMDAWYVITWLTELRVSRLIVENVPEFVDWTAVNTRTGRPIESRRGEYFRAWVEAIRGLGFKIDWAVLNCADYGDATTRQRFFLIARSDGRPLRWPTPTHSREGSGDLFGAGSKRWLGADSIIDWDVKGKSIYARRKSLSGKTLLRVLSGIVRFGWHPGYAERLVAFMLAQGVARDDVDEVVRRSRERGAKGAGPVDATLQPFIAVVAHGAEAAADNARRVRGLQAPLDTIHAGGGAFGLVGPGFTLSQASCGAPRAVADPVPAIVGAGAVALIAPYYSSGSGETCRSSADPLPTLTGKGRLALVTAREALAEERHGRPPVASSGCGACVPATETPRMVKDRGRHGMVMPLTHGGGHDRVRSTDEPLPTVTGANRGEIGFITASFGEREGQLPRTHRIGGPVPTICAQGNVNLVTGETSEEGFDIRFRMLTVRELARATSLDLPGAPYQFAAATKTQAIKLIGNAVPSATAEALVRAMFVERQ